MVKKPMSKTNTYKYLAHTVNMDKVKAALRSCFKDDYDLYKLGEDIRVIINSTSVFLYLRSIGYLTSEANLVKSVMDSYKQTNLYEGQSDIANNLSDLIFSMLEMEVIEFHYGKVEIPMPLMNLLRDPKYTSDIDNAIDKLITARDQNRVSTNYLYFGLMLGENAQFYGYIMNFIRHCQMFFHCLHNEEVDDILFALASLS